MVMKKLISIIISLLFGAFIGFFGVFNSVFSDGSINERLITIGVIMLIYIVISFVFGLTAPAFSWQWGILISSVGVVFLVLYSIKEFSPYYLIYLILIIGLSCKSSYIGNKVRSTKKS